MRLKGGFRNWIAGALLVALGLLAIQQENKRHAARRNSPEPPPPAPAAVVGKAEIAATSEAAEPVPDAWIVSGRAVRWSDRAPVPGALVLAFAGPVWPPSELARTIAGPAGEFALPIRPAGRDGILLFASTDDGWKSVGVELAREEGPAEPIEIPLMPGTSVTGRVQSPDGDPVADAVVEYWSEAWLGGSGEDPHEGIVRTDDQGRFTTPPLLGLSSLFASADGWAASELELLTLDPDAPPGEGVVLRLQRAQPVAGRVLAADGGPAAGVEVRAFLVGGRSLDRTTDALGEFRFEDAPEGGVIHLEVIGVEIPAKVVQATPTWWEFRLRDARPGAGGRVVDAAGRPVADAPVELQSRRGEGYAGRDRLLTDEEGEFWFATPVSGEHRIVSPQELFPPLAFTIVDEDDSRNLGDLRCVEFACFHPHLATDDSAPEGLLVDWAVEPAGGVSRIHSSDLLHLRLPRAALPARLTARWEAAGLDLSAPATLDPGAAAGCVDVSLPLRLDGVAILTAELRDADSGRPVIEALLVYETESPAPRRKIVKRTHKVPLFAEPTVARRALCVSAGRIELKKLEIHAVGYEAFETEAERIRETPGPAGERILDLGVVELVRE